MFLRTSCTNWRFVFPRILWVVFPRPCFELLTIGHVLLANALYWGETNCTNVIPSLVLDCCGNAVMMSVCAVRSSSSLISLVRWQCQVTDCPGSAEGGEIGAKTRPFFTVRNNQQSTKQVKREEDRDGSFLRTLNSDYLRTKDFVREFCQPQFNITRTSSEGEIVIWVDSPAASISLSHILGALCCCRDQSKIKLQPERTSDEHPSIIAPTTLQQKALRVSQYNTP